MKPQQLVLVFGLALGAHAGCGDDSAPESAPTLGPPGGIIDIFTGNIALAGSAGALPTEGGSAGAGGDGEPGGSAGMGAVTSMGGRSAGGASTGGRTSGGAGGSGGRFVGGGGSTSGGSTNGGSTSGGVGGFPSLPQGIVFSEVGTTGIALVSSHLRQQPSGADTFKEWIAEVANRGTTPACFLQANIVFQTSAGAAVVQFNTYVDADAYRGSTTGSVPCIPPLGRGVFYSNDISPEVDFSIVRRAVVTYTTFNGNFAPHPGAPIIVSAVVGPDSDLGAGYWSVRGTVRATQTVNNLNMAVYPKSTASGLLLDYLIALETSLAASNSWSYETTAYKGAAFSTIFQFLSFTEPLSAYAPANSAAAAESAALAELEASRAARLDRLRAATR